MEERRIIPRHVLQPALASFLTVPGSCGPMPAAVLNVSTQGMELYLARPPEVTDSGFLQLLDGPIALRRLIALRIIHVRPAGDGGHLAGVHFVEPLTEAELGTLRNWER